MTEEDSNLTLCLHCSKPIAKDSVFCSYCGKEQKRPEEKLPGQIKLFFLNLMCPGAGDWCLGAKWRATFIFLVVIGSLVAYCLDIIPIVQKAVNDAVLRNNFKALNKLNESVSNNGWMYLFTIAYIFSFVDSIFLRINKQKLLDEDQK